MCDCIKELEKKVFDHVVENKMYKKKVVSVDLDGRILQLGGKIRMRLSSNFLIELEGQQKKPTMPVTWSHCPFCGEKLES